MSAIPTNDAEPVSVDDSNGVRVVGLARPDVHNALNQAMIVALHDALKRTPPNTRAIVLYGHGPSFCAGGDRREGIAGPEDRSIEALELLQDITRLLQSPDIVAIAAVEGWAIGGGAELALACDLIVAARGATFRFPEVELDAHATGGSTWLLPRTVGIARANLLFLTAMPLDAANALAWGLVAELAADGAALSQACALARRMAQLPDGAVSSMKRSMQSSFEGSLEEALLNEVRQANPRLAAGGFLGLPARRDEH